ncbi:hypothetical protein ABZ905_34355 [Streptomyces parvus]|uniref:hypothetical protein n=1 Tax=Streptomyces parvus TaxID=66428 RepID=UPI0033CECA78
MLVSVVNLKHPMLVGKTGQSMTSSARTSMTSEPRVIVSEETVLDPQGVTNEQAAV